MPTSVSDIQNRECLEGFRCPKCGSYEPFEIEVKTTVRVYDHGRGDMESAEWDDDSPCACCECGHRGVVGDFNKEGKQNG